MNFTFDEFDQFEIPPIYLKNPDNSGLYMLGNIYDRNLKIRYNALSEFTFSASKYIDFILNDYYDFLDYRRIVTIDGIGNFMITGMEETNDGMIQEKKIVCQSLETELNFKKLSLFQGTYKFYDVIPSSGSPTLFDKILPYIPGWTIGHIDSALWNVYRTFNITDATIYSFLMNDASTSYQCVFEFDTVNKKISAVSIDTHRPTTDIYLSYDNLIESVNIREVTDELVTALNVYGGNDLSIYKVNPLGTDTIYNFDYYKNTSWMDGSLITEITNWENQVNYYQPIYADTLSQLFNANQDMLALQAELDEMSGSLLALEEVLKVRIKQKLSTTDVNNRIKALKIKIKNKKSEINLKQFTINDLQSALASINSLCSFANNISPGYLTLLSNFIVGSTYTNANIAKYDNSTITEIQSYAQELYDQAVKILAKISSPRYTFDISSANFIFLKEFQPFISQLSLGCIVTVEFNTGIHMYPALLGIDFSYDNPDTFKLTFSNRLRLDDSSFQLTDLLNQSVSSAITTTFNSDQWSSWSKNSKDDVTTFINSALNVAKNAVTNASDQSITIDSNGLRGRELVNSEDGIFSDKQFWMINNMLAFTNDNWDTAKLALGEISYETGKDGDGNPTYSSAYGLAGEVLIGKVVASNQLIIQSEDTSFTVDANGATLYNASFTIRKAPIQIVMDGELGIEISKLDALGKYTNRLMYIDTAGNLSFSGSLAGASGQFTGTITANSGKIGSWTIDNDGLYDTHGNYIYGNGKIRLGKLTIDGSNADFAGTFHANNLADKEYFSGEQLKFINADYITAGTIKGINIFGSNIMWPGVKMYSIHEGFSSLEATQDIGVVALNGGITINSGTYTSIVSRGSIGITTDKSIILEGTVKTKDTYGNTGTGISGTYLI